MKIGKISCEILSFTEFYERDALAIVGGAEHPMDVCLIKVETVDGIVGYGESLGYGAPQSVAVTVNKVLARLLEGEDSSNILGLWDKMYKASFRLGRRGVMISAMSGVDIALWDILGKELGAPIYKLLAARPRRVKGYITGGYYRPEKDIQRLIEEVRSYREKGFDTVKIKIGGVSLEKDF
ncbi:MAG: mandelate racemase/muconate lactonizing enzyme family protein, partial [Nitrososphaerota archaeon]|nr:mandelate racemase/muconate lactonizing enzyme family protein [Nitrososphaerota archaeon]